MSGDRLAQQRETLVGALNDARPSPDWAWEVLNTWDALVEIAKAAREVLDYEHTPSRRSLSELRSALARLDSGAAEEDA